MGHKSSTPPDLRLADTPDSQHELAHVEPKTTKNVSPENVPGIQHVDPKANRVKSTSGQVTIVSRHDHHARLSLLDLPILWSVPLVLDPHRNDRNQHEQHAQKEHHGIHTSWLLGFLLSRG